MPSPDEEIAGQVFGGCGKVIFVVVIGLGALVGLIAIVIHMVK